MKNLIVLDSKWVDLHDEHIYNMVCFSIFFYSYEKKHKMKISIVLDSKWVDLHSEYIIWYALVHFFTVMKKSINLKLQQKNILKHTILYVHCVDLLIWSLIQLDFLFYDFFCDLLWFFKTDLGGNLTGFGKFRGWYRPFHRYRPFHSLGG